MSTENIELQQLVVIDDDEIKQKKLEARRQLLVRIKSKFNYPYLGIMLASLSSLFFSLCSVIVKDLIEIHPIELAAFRFAGVLFPTIPILIYMKQPIFPEGKRIILLLRCFTGTTGLMLSFYAFRHMPLADASVIIFSTPVFVAIFARIFLKEPCSYFNLLTIILTLIGVVLITRPPFLFGVGTQTLESERYLLEQDKKYDVWGPIAAISATLFGANVYILLRALKGLHFSVIMVNFGAFALVYTLIVCKCIGALRWPTSARERWLILVLGIFSFLGQILLTLSLQMEQAGPVAIARCVDIVFAFIWQMLFFGEPPTGYSLAGALLVVSSVILTAIKKYALSLPIESKVRQRLKYLILEETN